MLLTIDIGNSFTKASLFNGNELHSSFFYPTNKKAKRDSIILSLKEGLGSDLASVKEVIASSVVANLNTPYEEAIKILFSLNLRLIKQGETGIVKDAVDNIAEVGADILSAVRGAYAEYGGNLFIADLGTADKFIYVSKDGVLEGLAIDCGLSVALNALSGSASALNKADLILPSSPLGRNTNDCIASGLLYGTIYKIESFKKAYEEMAEAPLKGILTGGNAPFLAKGLKDFTYDKYLVLKGLKEIATL